MSRYIQDQADKQPKKEEKDPKRELKKPGKYDGEDLRNTKDRPFLGGNYNGR